MHIELTEQERLRAQQGQPVEVIDPQTKEAYILIAKPRVVQSEPMLTPKAAPAELPEQEIPEGIRVSKEAYRRDLPELLKQENLCRQWVAYHRNERIGIARRGQALRQECYKRGLAADEFFVGWIDSSGLIEEEEVEPRLHHYEGFDDEDS